MLYTLAQGARGYDTHLHYSLYGGVEYWPDRSLAVKELLPLAAIPAAAIALLASILNFHVPAISTPSKSGSASEKGNAVLSFQRTSSGGAQSSSSSPTVNGSGQSSSPVTPNPTTDGFLPSGSGSVIGGMGGGDTTGALPVEPTPTPSPTPDPTNIVQADATVTNGTAQVGVDVFLPATGTSASLDASLSF